MGIRLQNKPTRPFPSSQSILKASLLHRSPRLQRSSRSPSRNPSRRPHESRLRLKFAPRRDPRGAVAVAAEAVVEDRGGHPAKPLLSLPRLKRPLLKKKSLRLQA